MATITTREVLPGDLQECLHIEAGAMPGGNLYLKDVIDLFRQTKGELTLGLADGQSAGIGKLTVLFDGSAWLETLRVHPDYQRRGVAAKIYESFRRQWEAFGCPAVRMYTGVNNVASAALAEKNGLHRGMEYRGMSLSLAGKAPRNAPLLKPAADGEEAWNILNTMERSFGDHLSINHTFYAPNRATCGGFANMGWIYGDEKASLVMGARFQPRKALYIAAIGGDRQKALDFAMEEALRRGAEKLTAHFPNTDELTEAFYAANGFTRDKSDDVVMETAELCEARKA